MLAWFTAIAAMTGCAFLALAVSALAAPENAEVEAMAEQMAEDILSVNKVPIEELENNIEAPLIVVDAGHGGLDEGCNAEGVLEKDINLAIAGLVRDKLTDLGYRVFMPREEDVYIAKEQRVESANQYQADLYVSIHQNAYEDTEARGIETWYYGEDTSRDSARLAQLIHQETLKTTGAVERELRDDAQLCVTGQTLMPACLIETGFLTNEEDRALLVTAAYQEQIAAGIARGIDLYFNPKTMYLTFDDGPSQENTSVVLDILKARNIRATFFVVGENVRKHPEVARRIVAEGHTIGIHCNDHDYETIYESADSYLQDFEEARAAVLEVTGVDARLFRFPGGSVNAYNEKVRREIVDAMTANGYLYFDWNASLEDATVNPQPLTLIENAKESTLDRKKVVMLAHDVIYATTLCLDDLIDSLPEYQMEPLTTEVDPIQFKLPENEEGQ